MWKNTHNILSEKVNQKIECIYDCNYVIICIRTKCGKNIKLKQLFSGDKKMGIFDVKYFLYFL